MVLADRHHQGLGDHQAFTARQAFLMSLGKSFSAALCLDFHFFQESLLSFISCKKIDFHIILTHSYTHLS